MVVSRPSVASITTSEKGIYQEEKKSNTTIRETRGLNTVFTLKVILRAVVVV